MVKFGLGLGCFFAGGGCVAARQPQEYTTQHEINDTIKVNGTHRR